jgi:hypothetical protein
MHDAAPSDAATIVWLVHGTFAPFAPFMEPNSCLRRELAVKLGPVTFHEHRWGRFNNSFFWRRLAGRRLAAKMADARAKNPTAPHVVIAHSHGGTVALAATADWPAGIPLRVVTMATPFIQQVDRHVSLLLAGLVLATSLAVWTPAWVYSDDAPPGFGVLRWWWLERTMDMNMPTVFDQISRGVPDNAIRFEYPIIPTIVGALVLAVVLCMVWYVWRAIPELNRISAPKQIEAAATPSRRLLVMSVKSDEARLWLNILVWVCRAPVALLTAIGSLGFVVVFAATIFKIVGMLHQWFSPEIIEMYGGWSRVPADVIQGLGMIFLNFADALCLLSLVFSFHVLVTESMARGLSVVMLGTQLGFGGLLLHARKHVWAVSKPNDSRIEFVEFDYGPIRARQALNHSQLYGDSNAIARIAAWILQGDNVAA